MTLNLWCLNYFSTLLIIIILKGKVKDCLALHITVFRTKVLPFSFLVIKCMEHNHITILAHCVAPRGYPELAWQIPTYIQHTSGFLQPFVHVSAIQLSFRGLRHCPFLDSPTFVIPLIIHYYLVNGKYGAHIQLYIINGCFHETLSLLHSSWLMDRLTGRQWTSKVL